MESNQTGEPRKPKRPRIGATTISGTTSDSRFEKVNYGSDFNRTPRAEGEQEGEQQNSRPYQPRPRYNQQQGGYQQRPYQPRPRYNQHQNDGEGGYQQRPYQP
ncbi:MAG: hypothetical protein K2F96_07670, partial [Muribaculaceae bacterium]|nr:hypothetical protein [Muribaculaceae bacterium]